MKIDNRARIPNTAAGTLAYEAKVRISATSCRMSAVAAVAQAAFWCVSLIADRTTQRLSLIMPNDITNNKQVKTYARWAIEIRR